METTMSSLKWYTQTLGARLFPLVRYRAGSPKSKTPLHRDWQNSRHSLEEIEAYAEDGHSIGWALGPNDLVVDVEAKTATGHQVDGRESFERLCADYQIDLTDVPAVSSPSGGRHYYFRKPAGRDFAKKLNAYPGIDFLREGLYVVIAGCSHWQGGEYTLDAKSELLGHIPPDAPEALSTDITTQPVKASDSDAEYTAEELEVLLESVDPVTFRGEGGGKWVDLMMACHAATGGCPVAKDVFVNWCYGDGHYLNDGTIHKRWDSCTPDGGITAATLLMLIRDRGVNPEETFTKHNQLTAQRDFIALEPEEPIGENGHPFQKNSIVNQKKHPSRYLVERVLKQGQPLIVGAPSKTLKTSILVDMAISLASGTPFLGYPEFEVKEPATVILLSGESGEESLQDTQRRICKAKGLDPDRDVERLLWGFQLPQLGNENEVALLQKFCRAAKAEVLVIDPAYLCILAGAGKSVNSADMMSIGPHLRRISVMAEQAGLTLIVVHHTRKLERSFGAQEITMEDLAGSGFNQWMRQHILISRQEPYESDGKHALLLNIGGSHGHSGKYLCDVDEGTLYSDGGRYWKPEVQPLGKALARAEAAKAQKLLQDYDEAVRTIVRLIRDAGRPINASYVERHTGHGKRKAQALLDRMLTEGRLRVVPDVMPKGGGKRYDGFAVNEAWVEPGSPEDDFQTLSQEEDL